MPRSTSMTVAAFAAFAACAIAAPAASQVTSAGGEVVSSAQKHLVDHLITIDSIQAATAKLAATKTQNASVREFANSLATDHSAHATALQQIAAKPDVGREAALGDATTPQFAHRYAALESMPAGDEFDKTFLQTVVANHQAEIATINSGKTAAKDEELKKDLDATTGALQEHVTKANELAGTLQKGGAPMSKPPR